MAQESNFYMINNLGSAHRKYKEKVHIIECEKYVTKRGQKNTENS